MTIRYRLAPTYIIAQTGQEGYPWSVLQKTRYGWYCVLSTYSSHKAALESIKLLTNQL